MSSVVPEISSEIEVSQKVSVDPVDEINFKNFVVAIGTGGLEKWTKEDFYANTNRRRGNSHTRERTFSNIEAKPIQNSPTRSSKDGIISKRSSDSGAAPKIRSPPMNSRKVYPVSGPLPFISYMRNPPRMARQTRHSGYMNYQKSPSSKMSRAPDMIERRNSGSDSSSLGLFSSGNVSADDNSKSPKCKLTQGMGRLESLKRFRVGAAVAALSTPIDEPEELEQIITYEEALKSHASARQRSNTEPNVRDITWFRQKQEEIAMDSNAAVSQVIASIQAQQLADEIAEAEELATDGPQGDRGVLRARSMSPRRPASPSEARRLSASVHNSHPQAHKVHHRSAFSELIEPEIIKRLTTMHDAKILTSGISKFNNNPKDGILYLVEQGVLKDNPEDISEFMVHQSGLSKRKMGEYFSRSNSFNQEVFESFLRHLDFRGLTLDQALRKMVVRFRMPGEAQQIDRIMEQFAKRWYYDSDHEGFSCVDTAYVLSFSLMMLNTDMYNRNLKESEKMTVDQFCNNNRGIDQGKNLPRKMLEEMYMRIQENEIRMDEGDMFESEVITFVAPKMSGWLRKRANGVFGAWKRHWFVLVDGVLYYFFAPQDEAPRCIIPLEHIKVDAIGKTDLTVYSTKDLVKSVKMRDGGRMEQGSHKEFVLRAEHEDERNNWMDALNSEASKTNVAKAEATPNKHGIGGSMRRRTSFEKQVNVKVSPPVMKGWARTQNDPRALPSRRYCAIFKGVESLGSPFTPLTDITTPTSPEASEHENGENRESPTSALLDILYFFGSSDMCDRMVEQQLHTSHGRINLRDVISLELRNLSGKGGRPKTIILYTGYLTSMNDSFPLKDVPRPYENSSGMSQFNSIGSGLNQLGNGCCSVNASGVKHWVFVPEDQFEAWIMAFMESCPQCGHPLVLDDPFDVQSGGSPQQRSPNFSGSISPSRSRRFSVGSAVSSSRHSPKRSILGGSQHSKNHSYGGSPY